MSPEVGTAAAASKPRLLGSALERADRRRDVLGEGAPVAPLVALDGLTEHLVSRRNRVTASPTASTVPAMSVPGTG